MKCQTTNAISLYLASPPLQLASTTCSLSIRNMNTARFCQTERTVNFCFFKKNKSLQNRRGSSLKQLLPGVYLRPVGLLLPEGHLISQDGSIVLNHHCLFFNVSSSKQPQPLRNEESGHQFPERQHYCVIAEK